MREFAALACVAAMAFGVPGAAEAQAIQRLTPFYLVVEHGHTIKLGNYSSVDPDCHVIGRAQINLLTPPQGGQVETASGADFPQFPTNNVRYACDRRKLATTIVYYHAAPNFTGADTFTIEAVFPNGYANQYRFTVNVR